MLKYQLSIVVEMEPCMPGQKLSPQSAIFACVERLIGTSQHHHRIIADSAFLTAKSITEFLALKNSVVSISIKFANIKLYQPISIHYTTTSIN